jgi:Acetyltransferase (GNAT) domain
MVENLRAAFVQDAIGLGAALETVASSCNPHALPQALAAVSASGQQFKVLSCTAEPGLLVGLWPMSTQRVVPFVKVLKAPLMPLYNVSGSPMFRSGQEFSALKAMVGEVKLTSSSSVMLIKNLQAEGPVWEALNQIAAAGDISLTVLEAWERAVLERTTALDSESYLALALSGSNRKRLRNKRRGIEEGGALSLIVHTKKHVIAEGYSRFLSLEAAGWKGETKTALRHKPADANYCLNLLQNMAAVERAFVAELRQGEVTIAAGLFLRCAGEVFFLKTAYDETLSKQSPGVIFDMMITDYLYQQPWFERLDSATDASVDPAKLIWKQRRKMANVVIDCKPHSLRGRAVVAAQQLRLWLKKLKNQKSRACRE